MAGRKEYKKIDIDVEPFLSIMAIVMKLISLILVIIVMRIAMNPKLKKVVTLSGLWGSRNSMATPKEAQYLDCHPDKVITYPGNITNTWEQLQRPDNSIEKLLDKVQANHSNEYVVIMARPQSVKVFRRVRKMVTSRANLDFGMDVVDANYVVNWSEALKGLSVSLEDEPKVEALAPPAAAPMR